MLLNKFDSPAAEGLWRAVLTAIVTGVSAMLIAYQANVNTLTDPERIKEAAIVGIILALAPFVSQGVMAASDQTRAKHGDVKPADPGVYFARTADPDK